MSSKNPVVQPRTDSSTARLPLLDCPAAAKHLGLSVSFLAKSRLRGDGAPYVKLGRRVLYAIEDLDAWTRSRRRNSTSE